MSSSGNSGGSRRRTATRLLLTLGVVVAGSGVVMGTTFATFTDTTSAGPQTIATGKLLLAVGPTNDTGTAANAIAPGDTVSREVDLNSTGSTIAAATITMQITPTTSTLLDSDATNGLQISVLSCSAAWTRHAGPPLTYTCSGTQNTVLASTPLKTLTSTATALPGLSSLNPGGQDYLVMQFTLPSAAPGNMGLLGTACSGTAGGTATTENLEGCSDALTYTFQTTQRAGTNQ